MGLYHLGLLAVEAVAVEGVWGRVHVRVEVDGCAGKTDASAFRQDGTVLEGDGLEYSALRGHCVAWVLRVSVACSRSSERVTKQE